MAICSLLDDFNRTASKSVKTIALINKGSQKVGWYLTTFKTGGHFGSQIHKAIVKTIKINKNRVRSLFLYGKLSQSIKTIVRTAKGPLG